MEIKRKRFEGRIKCLKKFLVEAPQVRGTKPFSNIRSFFIHRGEK